MSGSELQELLAGSSPISTGWVELIGGQVVRGLHPRVVTTEEADALGAGFADYLVMDVPDDPVSLYRFRVGSVVGLAVAAP